MKKLLYILVTSLGMMSCNTSDKESKPVTPAAGDHTTIEWITPNPQDLGSMPDNSLREVSFRFKNTGKKPLVIESATAGCGCTTPEKPKEPVLPGQEGLIKATFNSAGFAGRMASKTITVLANTDPSSQHELTFNVQVEESKN